MLLNKAKTDTVELNLGAKTIHVIKAEFVIISLSLLILQLATARNPFYYRPRT